MNDKYDLSLELLLLNDLFHTNAIDKDIYEKATRKIIALKNTVHFSNQPNIQATT